MRPERHGQALRLVAVPLCAGIVFAITRGLTEVWNGENLMPGFLYGCLIGVVLGIPLLLRSEAKGNHSKGRYLFNALIQALAGWLLAGASLNSLPLAIGRGVALAILFSATIYGIQKLCTSDNQSRPAKRAALYAVPLSGALTLGTTTVIGFYGPDIGLSTFVMAGLVGAFLSMLAGWPVLWFIERYLTTPLRYIAGGIVTGLLIWLCITLEQLVNAMHAMVSGGDYVLPESFLEGAVFFAFIGMVAGIVCTGIILGCERAGLNRSRATLRP
ncbi:hypothetical protein [Pseudomonas syringae]|uniref:hypothetical protein n=1 Tax=Pseudomonas syringae TaxID=317 RepID=UPI003F768BB9